MSGPSVWNGRNEKILGPSTDSNSSINTLTTSNTVSKPTEADKSAANKGGVPAPAPVPSRSVWNGKHDGVKAMATPSPAVPSSIDASKDVTAKAGAIKKKKGANVNAKTTDNNKVVLPVSLAKETPVDEGTNSTAGSSTANTLEDDKGGSSGRSIESNSEDGRQNVVVSVSSPSNTCSLATDDGKEKDAKDAKRAQDASSGAPPVVSVGEKKKKERSQSSGNMSNGGKGQQQHKKGGRQQNGNNNNSQGQNGRNKQHGNNQGRGSNGNNGRRKGELIWTVYSLLSCLDLSMSNILVCISVYLAANSNGSIHNGDKPVCAFFVRGMCNRGTSCAFKHDLSFAPAPQASHYKPANPTLRHGSNGMPAQIPPSTMSYNRLGSGGRVFDPLKAKAIQMAKDAQDKEDRSIFASPVHPELQKDPTEVVAEPPFFSIDVECIATGYGSCAKGINDGCGNEGKNVEGVPSTQYNELSHRYPGRVAMVDTDGNLLADILIRPPQDGKGVVSYLTALTGLTKEMCLGPEAKTLEEAVSMIKSLLPKDAVLVGQSIDHDVEWLGLTQGKDFSRMVDLSVIFRQRMPAVLGKASEVLRSAETGEAVGNPGADPSSDEFLGFDTRYRSFSLRHVCLNLLGIDIQSGVHDPIVDATHSLALFHKYRNSSITQLRIVRDGLHRAPVTPGFAAEKTPVLDGVCVSAAGYPYKRAARKIWRWYSAKKGQQTNQSS